MKTTLSLLLCAALLLSLAACAPSAPVEPAPTPTPEPTPSAPVPAPAPADPVPTPTPTPTPAPAEPAPSTPAPVPVEPAPTPEPAPEEGPRILIAYFTWADNTVVDDPAAVDVDATTSASVLAPGNAAKMAGWIAQECGGTLYSIVVEQPYSSDYDACLDRAADEKADNARPALVDPLTDLDEYDVVFLGFPNWWYTLPMAVLTFVEGLDFSGKTVAPFVTHGTGGLSGTIRDLERALPDDVTVLEAIGVYRPEVDDSQQAVQQWARACLS